MATKIKTKILIISDTHCAPLSKDSKGGRPPSPPFKSPLPSADLLIHCGDLTYNGETKQYHEALDMLKEIDAPVKLVIAGNHDLSLDRDFVRGHVGRSGPHWKKLETKEDADINVNGARGLWTASNGRAKAEGITFLDEGLHKIDLPNGARVNVYSSPYTPEFRDWGFPYERNEDRFNPLGSSLLDAKNISRSPVPSYSSPADTPLDILITHGPPYNKLDETNRGDLAGCPHLLRALIRSKPLLHCFGHIHEGWGAERITWTSAADEVATKPASIEEWKQGAWRASMGETIPAGGRIYPDLEMATKNHAAVVDGVALKRGEDTLLINAAIMDVRYVPRNAPWLVELDLPKRPEDVWTAFE